MKVCRYKPERKKERHFEPNDLGRIIQTMGDQGKEPAMLVAIAISATGNRDQWRKIRRVYFIVSWVAKAATFWLVIQRIRLVLRGLARIIEAIRQSFLEFPVLGESLGVLEEVWGTLKAAAGLIGGLIGVIKLMFAYDSGWVDEVEAYLNQYEETESDDMQDVEQELQSFLEGQDNVEAE